MPPNPREVTNEILDLGEAVSKLEHAEQCAWQAREAGTGEELVLAALLHDIGRWFADGTPLAWNILGRRAGWRGIIEPQGAALMLPRNCAPKPEKRRLTDKGIEENALSTR